MPSILESLYYGELNPAEKMVSINPEYLQLSQCISESMDVWKKRLSSEEYQELEELLDLYWQVQGLEMAESFNYGFKLGVRLISEVYSY